MMRPESVRVALVAVLALALAAHPGAPQSGRIPVEARDGMVVSSHHLASQAGRDVLAAGGNAIDAAVATAFALAVTLPAAGNIGGGGFLVYHGADGEVTTFDFREKAPLASTPEMFLDEDGEIRDNSNHEGGLSVGVPGTVAGLALAHQRLGGRPWAELVAPAVALARDGLPSSRAMRPFLEWVVDNAEEYPSTAAAFLKGGDKLYEPGEIWRQPDLAETLAQIQSEGRDGFYRGQTAGKLAAFVQQRGGLITEEDLAKYEAAERAPVHGTYREYDVYGMPPPSSGGVTLIEMLNVLEGYPLAEIGHNSALYLHLLTEAMRRGFADRAEYLGDPDFNPDMPLDRLLSKEHAASVRGSLSEFRSSVSDATAFGRDFALAPESTETTHISVVDGDGNAVSLTYTIEQWYGSKMVVAGAGFLLNNEMGDFNPMPGRTTERGWIGTPPNRVAPEKRMLSSMTPTIVARDGKPVLVIGSPGGRTIINTVLQVVLNVIDHGMNVAQAVEAGRIHHQWLPDETRMERWAISGDTRRLYEMRGHEVRLVESQGRAHGIFIDHENGLIFGAADTRAAPESSG